MDQMDQFDNEDNDFDALADLHSRAKELFEKTYSDWSDIHQSALDDVSFYNNKQWDDDLLTLARAKKEPVLTVNMLPQFVQSVENELRQREMAINFHAMDAYGSDETANIMTGLMRAIEQKSHAKSHYVYAAGHNGAMVPGFGFLKVELDYATNDPMDMNQDISIKSIKDPFKVVCDYAFQEPDASDANFWFEWEDYPIEVFKATWPGASPDSWNTVDSFWCSEETVRVARFWYKEETVRTVFMLEDTNVRATDVVEEEAVISVVDSEDEVGRRYAVLKDGSQRILLRKRQVMNCVIKWCDLSGSAVLDEGVWVGNKFPFVMVSGVMSIYNGTKDMRGMIRFARDSQKMLNYMASSAARRIGSANKSPWIVDMASIGPYKKVWDNANTNNAPYLPYNAYNPDLADKPFPPPVRADQTGQIQDLLAAAAKFESDLKRTIGIYDAGLGATPNEQSGVAIKTLAQQGQNANSHFSDGVVRALQRVGEIVVDLFPKVMDVPRVIRTIGADTKAKVVKINEIFSENGKSKVYDFTTGHYGVTVNVGPAYATARQAAIEQLLELARTNPALVPFIQDIIARNMDFDGKDVLVDRLTKMLASTAPQLVEGTPESEMPPEAQAAMTQMKGLIEQLTGQLQAVSAEAEALTLEKQSNVWELQSQMTIQEQKTKDTMIINEQQAKISAEIESIRAARDAENDEAARALAEINGRLKHQETMFKVIADLLKAGGPEALAMFQQSLSADDNQASNR